MSAQVKQTKDKVKKNKVRPMNQNENFSLLDKIAQSVRLITISAAKVISII